MLSRADLIALADRIPELGHGGREVSSLLLQLASEVTRGVIVDIGPYLGSTTAYLAIGAPSGTEIHAFDTWDADICDLKRKARQFHDMELPDDLLPLFEQNMEPFQPGLTIWVHRCNIDALPEWTHGPIAVFVDDIGIDADSTLAKMEVFGPHLMVGSKVLLLDYFWYESKAGVEFMGGRDYMRAHAERFRFLQRAGERGALFEVLK